MNIDYSVNFYNHNICIKSIIVKADSSEEAIGKFFTDGAIGNYMGRIWGFDRIDAIEVGGLIKDETSKYRL